MANGEKTLVLSEVFPPRHGGSGRWFFELYSRLPRAEYTIAAGCTSGDHSFDAKQSLDIRRIRLSSKSWGLLSFEGIRFYWRAFRDVRRLVNETGATKLHCGRCFPEGVIAWIYSKLYRSPYACYVHGEDIQTATLSREHAILVGLVLRNSAFLLANSKNTAALLKNSWQIDEGKIQVLYPGIDANRFKPAAPDSTFLAKMGWLNRTVMLTVGRLQKRKGHDMLIRALPTIAERYPDVLYAIVGGGDQLEELQSLAIEQCVDDRVHFLGELSDEQMIRCYQQCTLFLLPNREEGRDIEGFGLVLVEAQACGKPVLAGTSGGTSETMLVGKSGIVVDCRTPDTLAQAVNSLLNEGSRLRKRGEIGREYVSERYDWTACAAFAAKVFSERT